METKAIPSYAEQLKGLRQQVEEMLPTEALDIFDKDATQLQKTHLDILQLNPGDTAPDFSLPNAQGKPFRLAAQLESSGVVLVFYRGGWCPYCNLQLNTYQQILDEIKASGAQLVAISPQNPDSTLSVQEKNELQFEVLSDVGNKVARQFTTVFRNGDTPVETMKALGFDFDAFYSDDSRELPVPAVFIIGKDGQVKFAQSEGGDYRNRVEAQTILAALKG